MWPCQCLDLRTSAALEAYCLETWSRYRYIIVIIMKFNSVPEGSPGFTSFSHAIFPRYSRQRHHSNSNQYYSESTPTTNYLRSSSSRGTSQPQPHRGTRLIGCLLLFLTLFLLPSLSSHLITSASISLFTSISLSTAASTSAYTYLTTIAGHFYDCRLLYPLSASFITSCASFTSLI